MLWCSLAEKSACFDHGITFRFELLRVAYSIAEGSEGVGKIILGSGGSVLESWSSRNTSLAIVKWIRSLDWLGSLALVERIWNILFEFALEERLHG